MTAIIVQPVKIVSSMGLSPLLALNRRSLRSHVTCFTGEQSVGKSFALNHLADTSFAGSAMRTTGEVYYSSDNPFCSESISKLVRRRSVDGPHANGGCLDSCS